MWPFAFVAHLGVEMLVKFSGFFVMWLFISVVSLDAWSQTRNEKVRGDREKMLDDEHWIYDDLEAGLKKAKADGKPLMAVLRCIP